MTIKFAVIGINHNHIFGQVDCLLREGAEFAAFYAFEDELALPFSQRYPQARRVADRREILDDGSIPLVLTAAIPGDRAEIAATAMRHGKELTWSQVVMAANTPMLLKAGLVEGNTEAGVLASGQVAGIIEDLPSCAELVPSIVDEAVKHLRSAAAYVQ